MNSILRAVPPVFEAPFARNGQQQQPENGRQTFNHDTDAPKPGERRRFVGDEVLRGEYISSLKSEEDFSPRFNQQIDPRNQSAINLYQQENPASQVIPRQGHFVDQFI